MSLVIGCDTGNLSLDDIFRLISGIDVDGNIYIRVCDGNAPAYIFDIACNDFGVSALDILRSALAVNDDGEYCLNVSASAPVPPTPPSTLLDDILAYYNCNEGSGNAIDQVGSVDLTVDANYGETGILSDAFGFVIADTDYVGNYDGFKFAGSFSMSFWMKTSHGGIYKALIANIDVGIAHGYDFMVRPTGVGTATIEASFRGVASDTLTSTTPVNDGAWHHVVVTLNVVGGAVKIYVDGGVAEDSGIANIDFLPASRFYIGARAGALWYEGIINEIGIWERELTVAEVAELYNTGIGITYPF